MIDSMPKYKAQISREGHNLEHGFEFTSSTGHLLTLFADILNPDDTISGNISMFSRTNPINVPANVEVEQFIDYFFVPLEMIYSGFGDSMFLVNEPYSSMIKVQSDNALPVIDFSTVLKSLPVELGFVTSSQSQPAYVKFDKLDFYNKDSEFFSVYRNFFHNYINPNCLFYEEFYQLVNSHVTQSQYFSVLPADLYQPNILPLSLLAYNCVFEQFYRLDDREPFDNTIYNIDEAVYQGKPIADEDSHKFFSLKYRPYFFDYFTSAKVAPLLNPINLSKQQGVSTWEQVNNYMYSLGVKAVTSSGANGTVLSDATSVGQQSPGYTLSTAQLRSMFAVEKIMSVTNRAKKTYDAQVLAHMGAKVPRDVRHELHYLGTQRSQWKIGEVIATAGTSDTPLGDMAGKGYSTFSDNKIKFTAPCHGIFIGIYSAVPRMRYYAPLEKHMQISSRVDFWFEEYEKLGMQPIFNYEAFPILEDYSTSAMFPDDTRLGWQMRYQQYKQRYDKVSPAFINTVYLDIERPEPGHTIVGDLDYSFSYGNYNTWQNWVLSKRPFNLEYQGELNNSEFYASPTDLNNIMAVQYGWNLTGSSNSFASVPDYWKLARLTGSDFEGFTNNLASLFYRDPFIHFAKVDFKKVSKMSSNTLPDLNF